MAGGGEVLPKIDKHDKDAAALAVAFVAFWYHQRQARLEKRRHWCPLYEYVQSSFSLKLMPSGHVCIWLWFTPEELFQLVPLLNLEDNPLCRRYQADSVTAFCVVCAWLIYSNRWELLVDLFERSKSWLSTVFNDTVLYLVARYCEVLL
jgi:hypothetical protein